MDIPNYFDIETLELNTNITDFLRSELLSNNVFRDINSSDKRYRDFSQSIQADEYVGFPPKASKLMTTNHSIIRLCILLGDKITASLNK